MIKMNKRVQDGQTVFEISMVSIKNFVKNELANESFLVCEGRRILLSLHS